MRLLLCLTLCFISMAPGISAGDGAGMRASTGGGSAVGADCMGAPAVDFDARQLALSDAALVATWANSGTEGSGWNMLQATELFRPSYIADCDNGVPCVHIVANDDEMRSVSASATWTKLVVCVAFKGTALADEVLYQWSDASATVFRNTFVQRAAGHQAIGNTSSTAAIGGTLNDWNAICTDLTDPTAGTYSANGGSATAMSTLISRDDPDRVTIGTGYPKNSSWTCTGCKIGRIAMYTDTQDIQALSSCLKNQWGF